MDKKSTKLFIVGYSCLSLVVYIVALALPGRTGLILSAYSYVTGAVLVGFLVWVVVQLRAAGSDRTTLAVPDAGYWAYAIVTGVANAFVVLVLARVVLGSLFGVAFFVGAVPYAVFIGPLAVLGYVAVIAAAYLIVTRQPGRFAAAVLALAVPVLPGWLMFRSSHGDVRPRQLQLATSIVCVLAMIAVFVSYFTLDRTTVAPPAQATTTPAFDAIPNEIIPPETITTPHGSQQAPVGACVSLDGPRSNPRLLVVGCGTKAAAYKVVQRVETPGQCVADVDDKFYNNPPGGQWTACLDYVWSSQDCLSVGLGYSAFRVACDDRTVRNREKPTQLLADTTSANGCPDSGFAHPVRRFTVCTETQK